MDLGGSSATSKSAYVPIRNVLCRCNPPKKADVKISESVNNPNRLYFKCGRCNFFKWFDDYALLSSCQFDGKSVGRDEAMLDALRELKRASMEVRNLIIIALKFGLVLYVVLVIIVMTK